MRWQSGDAAVYVAAVVEVDDQGQGQMFFVIMILARSMPTVCTFCFIGLVSSRFHDGHWSKSGGPAD
jgi:hypothetical protein